MVIGKSTQCALICRKYMNEYKQIVGTKSAQYAVGLEKGMTNYHNGPQQTTTEPHRPCAYVLVAIHTADNAPGTHQTAPQTLKNYKHMI